MRPVSTAYRFETAAGRKREGVLLARRHYPLSSSAPPSSWKCVCVYVCVCMCVSWCGCAAAGQRPLLRQSDPSFLPLPHLPASHSTLSFFLSFPALFVAFSPLSAPQQTPEGIWIWAGETADKETGEREERREKGKRGEEGGQGREKEIRATKLLRGNGGGLKRRPAPCPPLRRPRRRDLRSYWGATLRVDRR